MWNAEGSSSRTSPLPECRISTSTTGVISASYPGLNPQGLKNGIATHSLGSFTYNRPKKGFDSGRNSCNSIELSEDIKCCPLTLWAEPKLSVWLITRILDIICSTARAFHSQSSASVDCTHHWDSALSQNIVFSPTDFSGEKWCRDYFLSCSALSVAEMIRAELVEIMKRIELPISEPGFGSEENLLSIKKALLSGYFMHVRKNIVVSSSCTVKLCRMLSENLSSLVKSLDHQKG